MQRVYLSGKITGLSFIAAKLKFSEAERKLKKLGYLVFNPMSVGEIPGYKWEDYMKRDIINLCECDFIYQLENWEESEGAKLEYDLATKLKIPVLKIL